MQGTEFNGDHGVTRYARPSKKLSEKGRKTNQSKKSCVPYTLPRQRSIILAQS